MVWCSSTDLCFTEIASSCDLHAAITANQYFISICTSPENFNCNVSMQLARKGGSIAFMSWFVLFP